MKPLAPTAVTLATCFLLVLIGTPISAINSSTPSYSTSTLGTSLVCYYCPYPTASSQCTDTKVCTGDNTMCKTTVQSQEVGFPFDGTESVIRDCAQRSSCAGESNDEDLGNTRLIFCCNVDRCNCQGLCANSSAMLTSPEIGMCAIGILVALIAIGL